MVDSRKIVKVFLASPGDLQDERRAAKSVIDEFNKLWADRLGYHVELFGWEDTVAGYGRPQEIINRDLERCELFIGMMWKRWGTLPSNAGKYTSGFEEEFETSMISRRSSGRPELSLLFKEIEPDLLRDPGEELQKVIKFKDKIILQKEILFQTFNGIRDLEAQIRGCITAYVQKLQAEEAGKLSKESQTRPSAESQSQNTVDATVSSETPLSIEGAKFLREFITKTEHVGDQQAITAVEVARFRLLAKIIGTQGNDERALGVHDANLLFADRSKLALGHGETFGLIYVGVENFPSENTSLWYWLTVLDGLNRSLLPILSLAGPSLRRVGALSAMRLISEPLHSSAIELPRTSCLRNWLSNEAPSEVKVAALGYLAECGIPADLPAVREEFARGNYQTTSPAVDAIIRINLRQSREQAIKTLYELQPDSLDRSLMTELFANSRAIGTELLLPGVTHRSPAVRATTTSLLRARGALEPDLIEKLLADDDATVRFEVLQASVADGRTFSEDEAKRILIKPAIRGFLSFALPTDKPGEECWKRHREQRFMAMSDRELEAEATAYPVFDQDARFVLDERHFSTRANTLRAAIDDHFEAEFFKAVEHMAPKVGNNAESIKNMRSVEETVRKEFTRKALDVLGKKEQPQDLGRIRREIRTGFAAYSDVDVNYMRKNGEWEDISLVIELIERPVPGAGLLSQPEDATYRVAASAIYNIGRLRLAELLTLAMPGQLLAHLIVEVTNTGFRALPDSAIAALLLRSQDDVRKAASLKCVLALSKTRLRRLLDEYISQDETHYYNVIHWLDLGVSVPKDRAQRAAEKLITKIWRA
jgi:hypothetical protein